MDRQARARRLAAVSAGLLLGVIGCGGSDDNPSASFDGEDCSYSGPESISAGDEIEASFENTSDATAALAFLALRDESARDEMVAMIGAEPISAGGNPPEEPLELTGYLQAEPGEKATQTAPLDAGTYVIDCVTFVGDAPDKVWRVAVLDVEE